MVLTRILFVSTAMSTLILCGTASAQQTGAQPYQNMPQQNSAQQGGQEGRQMSPREVHAYFRQVEDQINQAVQSGNARQLQQWTRNNFADGANFQAVIEIGGQNGPGRTPKEIRVLSLNKNDMLNRQQVALSIAPQFLNMVENYDLGIHVVSVQPVGNDAAVVKTRIRESGTIGGNGRQLGQNGTQGMGPPEPQNQEQDQGFQPGRSDGSRFRGQDESQDEAENEAQNGSQIHGQDQGFQGGRPDGGSQRQGGAIQGVSFEANAECTELLQRDPNSGHLVIGLSNCMGAMQF